MSDTSGLPFIAEASVGETETIALIAADKVQGTNVYNPAGQLLGAIRDVMLDKRRGQVAYAVMSFGGFLGIGEKLHPLPWHLLTYDETKGGYVIDIDRTTLQGAPAHAVDDANPWTSPSYGNDIDSYYAGEPAQI